MQNILAKRFLSPMLVYRCAVQVPVAHFASKGPLDTKEKGDEKQFFNKEDEKLLKNLLKKVQVQSKAPAEGTTEQAVQAEKALKDLFKKHKIDADTNKAFYDALVDWRKQF